MKEIELTQGKTAIVDDADFEWLTRRPWYFDGQYARNNGIEEGRRTAVRMHRLILSAKKGDEVDHINGDKLDNRRANLRMCTRAQNGANRTAQSNGTSGLKGVTWNAHANKWQAACGKKYLGLFQSAEAAARAYDAAAKKVYGEFARLNFGGDQ